MDDSTEPDRTGIVLRYVCAVLPMLFYGVVLGTVVARNPDRLAVAVVDIALGLPGLALIWWRRRWPRRVALATALLTAASATATGPAQVAYVSLCTRRGWREILPVAAVSWLCLAVHSSLHGINQVAVVSVVTGTAILGGLTVFGLYLGSRRDLAVSQRAAARAAEHAQLQRIERAKLAERAKIAQEMHDVLAHRLSLLSMLAGGLAYRTDLTPEETRRTAQAIQENAHESLNELRTVLGTLRSDGALEAPQPTLADLDTLFREVRTAGQRVDVNDTVRDRRLLPAQSGRHAYRIVQEALTNARKHAPGSRVEVELAGQPGGGLRIRVSNPTVPGSSAGPGAQLGLVGLAERTRLAGGNLRHANGNGHFVLDAQLPWEA